MNSFAVFLRLFDIADERFAILLMVTDAAGDNRPPTVARTGADQYRDGKLNCPARRSTRLNPRALNVAQGNPPVSRDYFQPPRDGHSSQ
jgi:hypothetical protein